jgi:phosphodiesterase/alkaline phosphatase D-like protein
MSVISTWVGAVTPTAAWVRSKVSESTSSVRLAVADNPDLSGPEFYGPASPTPQYIASIEATGLAANTQYWFALETDGSIDSSVVGRFRTHPPLAEPSSFMFAAASCAGNLNDSRVSNHAVFDTIRELDPLFFAHLGDLHYRDIPDPDYTRFREAYDDVLAQPRQHHLYRSTQLVYVWDDHDYGPNDSDRTAGGRDVACEVFRERVPHYHLPAGPGANPIYHSFQVGRVLFIASDTRADRDPNDDPAGPSKTMLGSAQKAWMEEELATSSAEFMIWLNPSQWMGISDDSWSRFTHERDELVQMFGDLGWLDRMCIISGDRHELNIDTGTGNEWGGFPVFQFASLDSRWANEPHTWYDTGPGTPGNNRYGTMQIRDEGGVLTVTGTGWIGNQWWRSHTFNLGPMYISVGDEVMRVRTITGEGSRQTFTVDRSDAATAHPAGTDVQIQPTGEL